MQMLSFVPGVTGAALLAVLLFQSETREIVPRLSALKAECSLRKDFIGEAVPLHRSHGLWLTCGSTPFLLVHPDNLVGKVRIGSAAQALEFARFFSSKSTFALVGLDGCVEIAKDPKLDDLYVIGAKAFDRYLKEATAEAQGTAENKNLSFAVSRAVVCSDQRVYELTDQIFPDGLSHRVSKRPILKSARTIGIVHWPDR